MWRDQNKEIRDFIIQAIKDRDVEKLKQAIKQSQSMSIKPNIFLNSPIMQNRVSPLVFLASSREFNENDMKIVKILLENDISVASREITGFQNTALLYASAYNNEELASLLIDYDKNGGTLNLFDKEPSCHNTPLILAIKNGNEKLAMKLLERDSIDPNISDAEGSTALHWAAIMRMDAVLNKLISQGADIKKENQYGANAYDYYTRNIQPQDIRLVSHHGTLLGTRMLDFSAIHWFVGVENFLKSRSSIMNPTIANSLHVENHINRFANSNVYDSLVELRIAMEKINTSIKKIQDSPLKEKLSNILDALSNEIQLYVTKAKQYSLIDVDRLRHKLNLIKIIEYIRFEKEQMSNEKKAKMGKILTSLLLVLQAKITYTSDDFSKEYKNALIELYEIASVRSGFIAYFFSKSDPIPLLHLKEQFPNLEEEIKPLSKEIKKY